MSDFKKHKSLFGLTDEEITKMQAAESDPEAFYEKHFFYIVAQQKIAEENWAMSEDETVGVMLAIVIAVACCPENELPKDAVLYCRQRVAITANARNGGSANHG